MAEIITRNNKEFRELDESLNAVIEILEKIKEKYKPSFFGERYYTSEEITILLGISKRTLQDYRDRRIIPYTSIGGKFLYSEKEIMKLLEENHRPARQRQQWE